MSRLARLFDTCSHQKNGEENQKIKTNNYSVPKFPECNATLSHNNCCTGVSSYLILRKKHFILKKVVSLKLIYMKKCLNIVKKLIYFI